MVCENITTASFFEARREDTMRTHAFRREMIKFYAGLLLAAFVWAGGCDDSEGTSQTLPTCGNGVVEADEVCDDGNNQSGDGCSADCSSTEICGNGILDIGEECDDGTSNSRTPNACRPGCHLPVCGDGIVDSEFGEVCDDGNTQSGDGCSADCKSAEICGNGIIDPWEECDDGNLQNWDGCNSCRISEFRVNSYTQDFQYYSSVAMAPDGRLVVVWISSGQDGSRDGIFGRIFKPDGTPDGSDFQVNTYTDNDQQDPDVAMAPDGHFVVVWESDGQDGDDEGVYARIFKPDGTPDGDEFQVNIHTSSNQDNPKVAMAPDGHFVVVWESYGQDGDNEGVYARIFKPDGTPDGDEFQVNATTREDQDMPDVAMAPDGHFVVVWVSYGQDHDGNGIYARIFKPDGTPDGDEFRVNSTISGDQINPAIAMAPDGRLVVVWESDHQDGWDIYARRFDPSGTSVGSEFRVNTHTSNDQKNPEVAMDDYGRYVVVWQSYGQDRSGYGVYAQIFDAAARIGREFRVNTYTDSSQEIAHVAMTPSGHFVVTWHSYGQDWSGSGVYAQRYTPDGAALGVGSTP